MQDAGPSSTLPTDDREDESGVDSTAGGKSHHPKKAAKARGRGRGAVKSRRGGGDGGGSDTSCSKEKDTSRDGRRTWTDAESDRLREVVEHRSAGDSRKNWQWVAAKCKMRWERILNPGVKRGLWTKEEDQKLKEVAAAMEYKWSHVAKLMGGRTYKQCRERYTNYLKEGLNVGPWTKEEDQLLLSMHAKVGNKWAEIARYLKDRSENMIKNEYMKLSRDANASQRRRQAHIDNHTQNSLDSSTNPNSLEVVVSGSPTAGEGGDGEAAKVWQKWP
ncbi:Myb-like DNA-binding domain [Ectocarpus siliculosus]|uniref:Myb-like DNA-binding domain n=1 Tax=Ectocarpus siliculosus TaxID=2880 RepID=D7FTK3_ECTSI|nr:Myb-like DNA-binding domain [Ectocarpus siliculosus]|eukprot:CBJ31394.1 Myb-like DNA-binding domain [Ectocarpus siliculosus]